jgi:hypothetical protein
MSVGKTHSMSNSMMACAFSNRIQRSAQQTRFLPKRSSIDLKSKIGRAAASSSITTTAKLRKCPGLSFASCRRKIQRNEFETNSGEQDVTGGPRCIPSPSSHDEKETHRTSPARLAHDHLERRQSPRSSCVISARHWSHVTRHFLNPSSARSLFATLEQPRRFHPIRPGRESRRRTAPAQRLDLLKERRIGTQRREILEEQREIAPFAENV